MTAEQVTATTDELLVCDDVVQEFSVRGKGLSRARISAVAGVSLTIKAGQAYAIVGETGSGKTTFARTVLGTPPPRGGRIQVAGLDVSGRSRRAARKRGRLVQMVSQDPSSALDPTWTVERIVSEPLTTLGGVGRIERRRRVAEILERVGLSVEVQGQRRPRELSGGQQQRVAIARALVSRPALVICDEPVTALDAASQAMVVELLAELKSELNLTYLLIAHDLAVVRQLADHVGTMYLGKLCETAPAEALFETPAHPYTVALLSAIPSFESDESRPRLRLLGEPPSPIDPPSGCRFRTRCPFAQDVCAEVEPALREIAPDHAVACHFPITNGGLPADTTTTENTTAEQGSTR